MKITAILLLSLLYGSTVLSVPIKIEEAIPGTILHGNTEDWIDATSNNQRVKYLHSVIFPALSMTREQDLILWLF